MKNSPIFYLIVLFFLTSSCGGNEKPKEIKWTQDQSSNLNKEWASSENYDINQFLERHKKWKMIETGTGLRYAIYKHGDGEIAVSGLNALVNFKITLLDGSLCYSSDSSGAETFLIDRSDVESGLQEGIKYMHVGDKAIFIIPSHLAHGLIGDRDKIPPLQTVIFDIELVDLIK